MDKKRLVVIGGGFAGSWVSKELEKKFSVTLIDTKSYFEFTPGILRTIVNPNHINMVQSLHTNYLKRAKIVIGEVKSINRTHVFGDFGKIGFDYLVISSGSTYELPIKEKGVVIATRADHLRDCYEGLCKAKKILIVGAGLVGCELAGEIIYKYKDKKIILIHAGDKIMHRNHPKSIKYVESYLGKRGLRFILGERARVGVNKTLKIGKK